MKFKSAVFAISILSSFSAFADSAPIEVSNEQVTRYVQFTNQTITVLYIRAVDDNVLINTIKASYSYQIQSGEITMAEVRNLMRAEMTTIHNSGNFHNSQVSTGNNTTNTMTINQNTNEELALICQKLIDVIDQSSAEDKDKDIVKTIVYEMKGAENTSNLKYPCCGRKSRSSGNRMQRM